MRYSDQIRHALNDTKEIKIKTFLGLLMFSEDFKTIERKKTSCLIQMVKARNISLFYVKSKIFTFT